MNPQDPRQILARRLRALREQHWPGVKVKQAQLAQALSSGGKPASVPLISSWESRADPQVPPDSRLEDLATFYATRRSIEGRVPRLFSHDEMTVQERTAREKLLAELTRLGAEARDAPGSARSRIITPGAAQEIARSLGAGPYRFEDGRNITIVCAQLPQDMLQRMPYTDRLDPDFMELYRYSDLDSLLELFGHLRAANPTSRVEYRAAGRLSEDDYTGHLVALGGVDWNQATYRVLERLQLPIKQVSRLDEDEPGDAYFEVTNEDGRSAIHRSWLDESRGRKILREDVALFAQAVSPYNRMRFVTICNGMYGRGTYGAVRALTDERFRDRNAKYIRETFGESDTFCILSRVAVENGNALTPDWTAPGTVLFKWSRPQ